CYLFFFFFSSRRRHTRSTRDWSSDVCSSDLAWVRHSSGDLRPPDFGSSAAFGKHTSWSTSSLVSLARKLSFPFWSFAEKPFVLVGTMKPRIDSTSSSVPVFAHTIATCAVDPFVIHILAPFSTQPSAVSFATVIIPAGFDP